MKSLEQTPNLSNEELEKNIKRKKDQKEKEFGPVRPKEKIEEDREKLIEEIRRSLGL